MSTHLDKGFAARNKILEGVRTLSDYVSTTLGPKGQNVLIRKKDKLPFITKDGVTVAQNVFFEDPIVNSGAEIVKQVSARTNTEAGDGTTTSTVLACSLLEQAHDLVCGEHSPIDIKRGLEACLESFMDGLAAHSKELSTLDDIRHVATISANNDEFIGSLVATAVDKVGKGGSITIEESRSMDTVLDLVEGFRFDSGWVASAFVTDERRNIVQYENPLLMVTDSKIERVEEILPALEIAARESRPFVIVADDIEGQALAALIMNCVRGSMKVSAVKAPGYGEERREILEDLATSTGAKFFKRENGDDIRKISLLDFGSSKTIEISKNNTTIVDGSGSAQEVSERIETLQASASTAQSLTEVQDLTARITRLSSGVAIIRVGGSSEVEMIEKKHRVQDALEAVRSAQVSGIIPGGGVTLLRVAETLNPRFLKSGHEVSLEIFKNALRAPFKKMAINSGVCPKEVLAEVLSEDSEEIGFDFYSSKLVNMYDAGIIDPARVAICAVKNAVSVVSMLLLTNHAIIET